MPENNQPPVRDFNQATNVSGLGVRRLQNTAHKTGDTISDIAYTASIVASMGYSPKKLVRELTR